MIDSTLYLPSPQGPPPTTMMQFKATAFTTTLSRQLYIYTMLLTGTALFAGCNHAPPPVPKVEPPRRIVNDYRNGWYHCTTGAESIATIATHYKRDPSLVAEINHSGGPYAVPPAGVWLYIPPSNNRAQVHQVLEGLQGHPELIPKTPWDPSMAARAQAPAPDKTPPLKVAQETKTKYGDAPPLRPAAGETAKVDYNATEPPPPAASELRTAGAVKKKRPGFTWFGLVGGSDEPEAKPAAKPVSKPAARPRAVASAAAKSGGGSSFVWPAKGEIVTPFKAGWRQACHGIEIAVEEGAPIRAAQNGKVLLAQAYPGYGKMVVIDHGNGFATMYGYNSDLRVKEGQAVERGQVIASAGRPSQGSSSKLLFQVRRNSLPVDPMSYLKDS